MSTVDLAPIPLTRSQDMSTLRILAVANQKGGVGKTTTAINLGTALAAVGQRVLIVDLDPQGNASTGLGIRRANRGGGAYQVLFGALDLADGAINSAIPRLAIVPSSVDLSGAEIELVGLERREFRLRDALRGQPGSANGSSAGRRAGYDYILIDCPPSLGLLTLNALAAADAVLVPMQCEFYALEGLSHLLRTVERVKRSLNPTLTVQGIVLTMFDKRNNLSDLVAKDVRAHLGKTVFDTVIPRNVRVSEAPSHGRPVLVHDMHCAGSQAYIHLASEVLKREQRLCA